MKKQKLIPAITVFAFVAFCFAVASTFGQTYALSSCPQGWYHRNDNECYIYDGPIGGGLYTKEGCEKEITNLGLTLIEGLNYCYAGTDGSLDTFLPIININVPVTNCPKGWTSAGDICYGPVQNSDAKCEEQIRNLGLKIEEGVNSCDHEHEEEEDVYLPYITKYKGELKFLNNCPNGWYFYNNSENQCYTYQGSIGGGVYTKEECEKEITDLGLSLLDGLNYCYEGTEASSTYIPIITIVKSSDEQTPVDITVDAGEGYISYVDGVDDLGENRKTYTQTCFSYDGSACSVAGEVEASREGYTFKGWGTSSTCIAGKSITEYSTSTSTTYYACWEENKSTATYWASFDVNGGTWVDGTTDKIKTLTYQDKLEFNDYRLQATNPGYKLCGWNRSSDDEMLYEYIDSEENGKTLVAQWCVDSTSGGDENQKAVDIIANAGEGYISYVEGLDNLSTGLKKYTQTCFSYDGSACSVAGEVEASREGYVFQGWGISSTCTAGKSITEYSISVSTTYYACWTKEPEKIKYYTVTFDLNGGEFIDGSTTRKDIVNNAEPLIKPKTNPLKEGYTFIGWYNGNTKFTGFNDVITNDLVLVARYEKTTEIKKCNEGDIYDPSINKCLTVEIINSKKNMNTIHEFERNCSDNFTINLDLNSQNCISGDCQKSCSAGYEKDYWKYKDTCDAGASCLSSNTLSKCRREYNAYCFKTYEPIGNGNPEVPDNPGTGSTLLYIVYLVGILSLCYTVVYSYRYLKAKK